MSVSLRALVTELEAAVKIVQVLVEGLAGLARSGLSDDTVSELREALVSIRYRQGLLNQAISTLKALHADGYPDVVQPVLSDEALDEIQTHLDAMDSAGQRLFQKVIAIITAEAPIQK